MSTTNRPSIERPSQADPAVMMERTLCTDAIDPRFGQEDGFTCFKAGDGAAAAWLYFHDEGSAILDAYLGERAIVPLEDLPAIYANLTALMNDPRVKAGLAAYIAQANTGRRARRAQAAD